MVFKKFILIFGLIFLMTPILYSEEQKAQEESDQQIGEFSLTGYAEKGKKNWDLSGKSADIFAEIVKLKSVIGNLYGKEEDIKLTADRGDFNKVDGKVHLEQDVVITTSSGTKLTTDSLDWDRKKQLVMTQDAVNIQRDNMVTVARGAKGEPNLKKVALEKEVKVDVNPVAQGQDAGLKEKITITCDGPLEIDYEKNIASFNNNVKVERTDSTIYSYKMDVFFIASNKADREVENAQGESDKTASFMGSKIDKIIARGNVKVVRGENISYSDEAIYTASDKKITLNGRPRLIIYSTEGLKDASLGN